MESSATTGNGIDKNPEALIEGDSSYADALSSELDSVKERIQIVRTEIEAAKSEAEALVNSDVQSFEAKRAAEVNEYRQKRMEEVRGVFEKEIAPLVDDHKELVQASSRLEKELLAELVAAAIARRN